MNRPREHRQAEGILRLLVEHVDPLEIVRQVGWPGLAALARRHGVLLRLARSLTSAGEAGPPSFRDAVREESERVRLSLSAIHRVSAACEAQGVEFLFPKAFQHLPDLGADLDLLIVSETPPFDWRLLQHAGIPVRERIANPFTRNTVYEIDGCPSLLDVQHGRLGWMGEHAAFPAMMLAKARATIVDGTHVRVPSPEHQLILQGMQRVFGRAKLRLSDLVYTMNSLRRNALDWREILELARRLGVFEGLACYLCYVEQIHRDVMNAPLLPSEAVTMAESRRWGRVEFRAGAYRFPVIRANRALYFAKLAADARRHNWRSAGRVSLAPAVAVAGLVRRVIRAGMHSIAASDSFAPRAEHRPRALS
jgi:hypothetical protein